MYSFRAPLAAFAVHLFNLTAYDFDCPGRQTPIMFLLEGLVWQLTLKGVCQVIAASFTAFVCIPVAAAVLYACK